MSGAVDQRFTSDIGAAFDKARNDKLRQIAVDAWAKWPQADGGGARRDFVRMGLYADPTWALIEMLPSGSSVLVQAIGLLLNRTIEEIRAARPVRDAVKAAGGGQESPDTQWVCAPANPSRDASSDAGGGQPIGGTHGQAAPATPSRDHAAPQDQRGSEAASDDATPKRPTPPRSNLSILADKQAARAAVAIRLSRLDTVMIGGKPIGDCTVSEVRAWATQRHQDARAASRDMRFALSLVANLPSGAVIREWWKRGDEVDELYSKAEAEYAA